MQAYRIRRRANARRITLKVLPDQSLEVVAPPRLSQRRIERMVAERGDWIAAARERILRQQQARAPELDNPFPTRIELPSIDAALSVQYDETCMRSCLNWPGDASLLIAGPKTSSNTAVALIRAMKEIAKVELEPKLLVLAETHGFELINVSWRNQKRRWGSCRKMAPNIGRISLNIRLLLLPPAVVRYVMLHELAHIEHPNHSPAFWRLVEQMQPDYRMHQQRIKQAALHLPCWIL